MAKLSPTAQEQATTLLAGSLAAVGASAGVPMFGVFNLFVYGTFVGTVRLERSFDGGTTWVPCTVDAAGDYASYSVPASLTVTEAENGMLYRINCTAYTSGSISYRLSSSSNFYSAGRGFT